MQARLKHTTGKLNFYQVLQVKPTASVKEIKTQYYKLCKLAHPDSMKHSTNGISFQELVTAYDILKDPLKRREYDRLQHAPKALISDNPSSDMTEIPPNVSNSAEFWDRLGRNSSKRAEAEEQTVLKSKEKRLQDTDATRTRVIVLFSVFTGYVLSVFSQK